MKKRKLYYIPMIHTNGELGNLQTVITEAQENVFGKDQTAAFFKSVEEYWKLVEKRLRFEARLFLCEIVAKVHVFVDSLPNEKEDLVQKIVDDLVVQNKIPAYQIIGELKANGAQIHGTESTEWLVKETRYWKDMAADKRKRNLEFEKELLENRDKAIIERINEVVPDEEIALIFIGRLHNVVEPLTKLPYNFELVQL